MKYLDNNEIKIIQKYLLEKEYLNNYSDNISHLSDDGNIEFNSKKITTKIDVDFFMERVKIYLVYPAKKKKKNKSDEENAQTEIFVAEDTPKNRLIIDKEFKIDDDFESVKVEGKTHLIPKYFLTDSIKSQDEKTWEMIFYQIFYKEITEAIKQ
ncbi:hypothetical protein IJ182_10895 [bacterium]|nr:hypothetical protein [bacterium]